eukprot:10152216-Alexandrium_andersonii.AAC.1
MGIILLAPTLRILKIPAAPVLTVYADDTNALARCKRAMLEVERTWSDLERVTALRSNGEKCKRWELVQESGLVFIR